MSFTAESRERSRPALPLAGMVDVLFLLLIFFMTSSVVKEAETQLPVELPQAESGDLAGDASRSVTINIDPQDHLYLGQRRVSLKDLPAQLRTLKNEAAVQTLIIRGDREARYGLGIRVMDIAQQAGLQPAASVVKPAKELQ